MEYHSVSRFVARELKVFGALQHRMNIVLRAGQVAMALSRQSLKEESEDRLIDDVWDSGFLPKNVLEQYRRKTKSGGLRPHTVLEFQAHLHQAQECLLRGVLVFYLAGFERFLKSWTAAALDLVPGAEGLAKCDSSVTGISLNPKHHQSLRDKAHARHKSVRVEDMAKVFVKAVKDRLERQEPVRRRSSSATRFFDKNQWHCMEVTEMWRQVRNVVVHHDGALDKIQEARYRDMWVALSRHSPKELPGKASAPIAAHRVRLEGYHVVYCFTNTWTTVNALLKGLEEVAEIGLGEVTSP
jgi:hypothetical protein